MYNIIEALYNGEIFPAEQVVSTTATIENMAKSKRKPQKNWNPV